MWGTATGDAAWRSCITRIVSPVGTVFSFLWESGAAWERGEGWWASFCTMRGAETRRGTLSSRAQEDLKKHLKSSKQMTGAPAFDVSRLPVRDFWSKSR